ncbi:hypothetical protein Tco_0771968 [Tanacetum coccineum]|uniref:Synaptobrevin, longin-like domain protein n=1 Tax=Tanacetum coccineum TaxID=301880 RepID=A0ABQ4ZJG6_9ASTR
MSITEASLRRHLKLDDQDGITSIPNLEIFEQLALMGYHTDSDKLTFQKGAFSPQWRFLIHNILHCLSPKKTAWEQVSSNIATAVICQEVALFPTMLDLSEPSTSPSRITSSPSHSPEPLPSPKPSFKHSPDHTTAAPTQPSTGAEHHFPTPHDSPLHAVHSNGSDEGSLKLNELTNLITKLSKRIRVLEDDLRKTKKTYSSAFTKLILRVKKLEARVKIGKARKRAKKASIETEPFIQEVTPIEVIQDQGSSEKGSDEVSTAGETKGTASEVPVVSTAEENISTAGRTVTYKRRSEEQRTRKDKGKAIMTESEPKKKSKKELEQEKLSFVEAIRLEEQMNEEQRAQIVRDEEIARQYFNQHIEPMDMEHGCEKMKSPKMIEEEDVDTPKEMKEVSKESGAKRKKSLPKKRRTVKLKNGIAIHMLTEKKYPLSQEMITKMLNKKLEVDHESSQAFELLSTNGVSTASTYLVLPELVNTARRKINTADGQSC